MKEQDDYQRFERFDQLALMQAELAQRGLFLHAVPKEHTEGLVTGPLLRRLHTQIKRRRFGNVAGHVAITFSGYGSDPREVYAIADIRAYWQALDRQLPELPALLAVIPALRFNGPGLHLLMLGTADAVKRGGTPGSYLAHVVQGPALIADGVARINAAGLKYHLSDVTVRNLVGEFRRGAGTE